MDDLPREGQPPLPECFHLCKVSKAVEPGHLLALVVTQFLAGDEDPRRSFAVHHVAVASCADVDFLDSDDWEPTEQRRALCAEAGVKVGDVADLVGVAPGGSDSVLLLVGQYRRHKSLLEVIDSHRRFSFSSVVQSLAARGSVA